jgi:CRISPR-associated protein Cmx8
MKGGEIQPPSKAAGRAIRRGISTRAARKHVGSLATDKASALHGAGGVLAVESYHMLKLGNNVKMLSSARVADRPGLTEEYARIGSNYRNPLFRAALMRSLIERQPWHAAMIELFAEYPWPFFIEGDDAPKYLARFGRDANDLLRASNKDIEDMKIEEMNEEERLKHLSVIIKRVVDNYVEGRAEAKTGKKVSEFPKETVDGRTRRVYPNEFREAQQRVCSDAFLSMRSRHDQDFVDYFVGSICSVAQYISGEELQFLVRVLMTKPDANPLAPKILSWEDVKAVAMIAVSACSYRVRPRDVQNQGSPS